ncbi:Peroxisomal membrane protein 4 [Perkinsus olseni]|uniref:Peroxisomal membrane protein 4 n=2 Tax=Perkinsus olseni TaxID=32597 RepID=A0A7J6MUC9_PEROL|nr:Peroxisomal membrane protein 4 [Perkinsus olseni]KAF4675202.1 Peroxisomal membrane protein 4 [Perkinsus olseni]
MGKATPVPVLSLVMPDHPSRLPRLPPIPYPTVKECLLAACLSARNGFEYAAKLRLAHCVVMTALYGGHRTPKENVKWILQSAREHGVSLGSYAFTYTLLRGFMDRILGAAKFNPAVAGFVAGCLTWGRHKTAISYQVTLYLLSRITVGSVHHQVNQGRLPDAPMYRYLAGFVWAVVMYLFVVDKGSLQSSLRQAMEFIYDTDDGQATELRDFLPFLRRGATRRARPGGDVNDVLEDVLENVDPEEF